MLEDEDIALKVQLMCKEAMPEALARLSSIASTSTDPKFRAKQLRR
jgi:hypothetical protein